jgi:capsular polysaccharide biosynthesis protein
MLQRATEIVFKHKLVIFLPLVLVSLLSTGAALRPTKPQWKSWSTVWVDQDKPLTDSSLGLTAANDQAALLEDFIHSRSFSRTVLQQTSMASAVNDPKTEDRADQALWQAVKVDTPSANFLTITVTTPEPDLSFSLAKAINSNYQTVLQQRLDQQSAVAGKLYGDAVAEAQRALDASRSQLALYLALHPGEATVTPGVEQSLPLSVRDRDLGLLLSQVNVDEQTYNTARQQYLVAEQRAAATNGAQPFAFTVVDAPVRAIRPVQPKLIDAIKLPLIGIMLGLMLSCAVATVLIYTDHTIRDARDLEVALGIPVLGVVSDVELRKRRGGQHQPAELRSLVAAPARRFR